MKKLQGLKIRILQAIAFLAPGASSLRVSLHRKRGVKIGPGAFIGTACILETSHPELVEIGARVAISMRVTLIGHFNWKRVSGPTVVIEDDVYIGPGSIIMPNVSIGRGSVVAAGSVVYANVKPGTMVRGNPAKPIATCGVPMNAGYDAFMENARPIKRGKHA